MSKIQGRMIGAALATAVLALGAALEPAPPLERQAVLADRAVAGAPLDIGSAVDVAYIQAFRRVSGGTKLDTIASDNVPAFGRNLCSGIDDGATLAQLTKAADLLEVPRDVFRAVISTSEAYYCREHIGYNI